MVQTLCLTASSYHIHIIHAMSIPVLHAYHTWFVDLGLCSPCSYFTIAGSLHVW